MPTSFQIPDLTKLCGDHFDLRVNEQCYIVKQDSLRWAEQQAFLANEDAHAKLVALQIPLLASLWYPTCDLTQLRTATDLLTLLFYECYHSDDSEESLDRKACRVALDSVVDRMRHAMIEQTSRWTRFQTALSSLQVAQRSRPVGMSLTLKRSSEIFGLAFTLLEYTEDLKIPDEVMHGHFMGDMRTNALDAMIWMKEIAAYNIQQSKGDPKNLVSEIMKEKGITLQAAITQATNKAKECLRVFVELSSSGQTAALSDDERRYVQGIRDCVVGWAHWVYETEEYFAKNGEEVKAFGWVFLLPKEGEGEGK